MADQAMEGSSPSETNTDAAAAETVVHDAAASTSTDANAAASSDAGAGDAKAEPSLLDVLKDAVKPKTEEASSTSETKVPPTEGVKPEDGKSTEEEPPPFHAHPRWKAMLEKNRTLEADAVRHKADAAALGQIDQFMQANGLSHTEVAEGYTVMALIRNDPAKARERLAAYVDQLDLQLGNKLPSDLQQKVDSGFVEEASAKELAKLRLENATRAATDTQSREAASQQAAANLSASMSGAVTAWESTLATTDPDYPLKAAMVADRVHALLGSGQAQVPRSTEEAVALAKRAYEDVNVTVVKFRPQARPTAPQPRSSAAAATRAPTSMLDAIKRGLGT